LARLTLIFIYLLNYEMQYYKTLTLTELKLHTVI